MLGLPLAEENSALRKHFLQQEENKQRKSEARGMQRGARGLLSRVGAETEARESSGAEGRG